jgi:hypothetical protein
MMVVFLQYSACPDQQHPEATKGLVVKTAGL